MQFICCINNCTYIYVSSYVYYFSVEVRIIHAKYGCLDVFSCRKSLDLDEYVIGSTLIQDCLDLFTCIDLNKQ